jgi:uncharacterized phage protein gp47/JayE
MSYGVLLTGFNIKRLTDIKTEIENEFKGVFGDIDLNPDSVFGQIIGILSKREADLWEVSEDVYLSEYSNSAEGVSLDGVIQNNGLTRLPATKSTVPIIMTGTPTTVIPIGLQVRVTTTGELFVSIESVVIPTEGSIACNLESVNYGKIIAPENTITEIVTPLTGLDTCTNLVAATLGREIESDIELRIRRKVSLRIQAVSTVESIKARILQDVAGVTLVTIKENVNGTVDLQGRPGHSFETAVTGGSNQDILDKIWELKPAGIETYGNVTGIIVDSGGVNHTIKFSRPVTKYIWIKVSIELNLEEVLPADGIDQIKNAMLLFCNSEFTMGDDIIIQKLYAPVFEIVGVYSALIEIAATDTIPGSWPTLQTTNIAIGDIQLPAFDLTRINVVIL